MIGDPYCTLGKLKDYLKIPLTMSALDEALTDALQSASEEIERHTNRQFNTDAAATARVYEPRTLRITMVDDFWTLDGLVVETDPGGTGDFTTVFGDTDYELFPLNGLVSGKPWPYNKVRANSGLFFPKFARTPFRRTAVVRVTAQWGWASVPAPIQQACLILAASNFSLKDAPLGVAGMAQGFAGSGTAGVIRVQDNKMAAAKLLRYVFEPSSALVG